MNLDLFPKDVEPIVVLGNQNNYLVVYTMFDNTATIELLERTLNILRSEESSVSLTKH